jgi:hypothetical protein
VGSINFVGTGGTTTSINGDTVTIKSTIGTITNVTSQAAGTGIDLTPTTTGSVTDIALTFNGSNTDYINGAGDYIALSTLPQRTLQQVTDAGSTTTNSITVDTLTSTQVIGAPPLVITSTTLVPNLYVARAVLADNATTNANLTGMVTSVGNATTVVTNADLSGMVTSSGNTTTVVTNADLTGEVTSSGNAATILNAAVISKVLTGYTSGTGAVAATDTILEAIQKLNGNASTNANLTGMVTSTGNATTVVTNADLTGEVTSTGNATTVLNATVIDKVLTGYVSAAGAIAATDNILEAIQKLDGNNATNANLTGMVTSVGNATTVVTNANLTSGVTSVGNVATVITNANLTGEVTSTGNATVVPNATVIGKVLTGYTPGAGVVAATDTILQSIQKLDGNSTTISNLTGMVTSVGNATTVVTNANLTGVITSVGNATSITSQTGTGTKFVVDTSPILITPNIGVATGTSLDLNGFATADGYKVPGGNSAEFLTSDGGVNTEVVATNTINAFTRQQHFPLQTITVPGGTANISWDLDTQQKAFITNSRDMTFNNPTNMRSGGKYTLYVQHVTTGYTVTFPTTSQWKYRFPISPGTTLSSGSNQLDIMYFESDGVYMYCTHVARGFGGTGLPPADSTPPVNPTIFTAGQAGDNIRMAWNNGTDNIAVASYSIRRNVGAGAYTTVADFSALPYPATAFVDQDSVSNFVVGTTYNYQIMTKDTTGNTSAWGDVDAPVPYEQF